MNQSNSRYNTPLRNQIAPSPSMEEGWGEGGKPHCKTETHRQKGFSLIEIIVSLMIVGIMSAVVYSYMGSSLTNSAFPVIWLNDAQTLNEVMERIKTDYDDKFDTYPTAPWIYNFFNTDIKNASYISEVDSYDYQQGDFNTSYTWYEDSNGSYIRVTLTKDLQELKAVFSE